MIIAARDWAAIVTFFNFPTYPIGGEGERYVDLTERYQQRIEDIIHGLRQDLAALPDGPEKEQLQKALEELERIAGEKLQ